MTQTGQPRIGILIVAYNAVTTLTSVLDRIPDEFKKKVEHIFVCDDASKDATYLVGLGYKQLSPDLPLTVIRHDKNLGYGGNQKAGYGIAIEHGLDIVVLLHGDGQYAPELLPEIVAPLEKGECDAVFGSRMMNKGEALRGGMPRYKYLGNRILTRVENAALGLGLTEFHSGYRAYSVAALEAIPFERNTDDFNFDTQIIIQLHDAGKKILEVPIPTYYGDEICYVNGMKYAKDVVADVLRYRMQKAGLGHGSIATVGDGYQLKADEQSSHGRLVRRFSHEPPRRILDLGCSGGELAQRLRAMGHQVTGVDAVELAGVHQRVDRFFCADLDAGIPEAAGGNYDFVVCADVVEHTKQPEALLRDARRRLRTGGALIASVPNFGHWYPRARVTLGAFDYDQRGILDKTHLRFFTRKSFQRLARRAGFEVRKVEPVGLPVDVLKLSDGWRGRFVKGVERVALAAAPKLFAYQFLFEMDPAAEPHQQRQPDVITSGSDADAGSPVTCA